ncbi:transposase, partial [Siminovitchia sediminis]
EVIAFETSSSPNQELICRTIRSAQQNRKLKNLEGVLIHSDRGSVYRSLSYHELSEELGFTPSMSRKANCWDNAVIESFFSHLKVEYPLFCSDMTLETCRQDLLSYISYFNERRIQKKLGYVAPKTYLKNFKKAA